MNNFNECSSIFPHRPSRLSIGQDRSRSLLPLLIADIFLFLLFRVVFFLLFFFNILNYFPFIFLNVYPRAKGTRKRTRIRCQVLALHRGTTLLNALVLVLVLILVLVFLIDRKRTRSHDGLPTLLFPFIPLTFLFVILFKTIVVVSI